MDDVVDFGVKRSAALDAHKLGNVVVQVSDVSAHGRVCLELVTAGLTYERFIRFVHVQVRFELGGLLKLFRTMWTLQFFFCFY